MFGQLFRIRKKAAPASVAAPEQPRAGTIAAGRAIAPESALIDQALRHHQAGRLLEAEAGYRELLAVNPDDADAWHFLGVIAYQRKQYDEAAELISQAVLRNPGKAAAHYDLGNTFRAQRRLEDAVACHRRVLDLAPDHVGAHFSLGEIFKVLGELDKAEASHRQVLALLPDSPIAHSNLGNILVDQGKPDQAIACYTRALELDPGLAEAYSNLGGALRDLGRPVEAMTCDRKAIALKPDLPEAHLNLGNALKDAGRTEEAVSSYRRALELKRDPETHSNLLFALNHVSGLKPAEIYTEHRAYARCFCPEDILLRHRNVPDPERRLRIGYVSGDFRTHPVAHFVEPVIARHDRERLEIFCYYNHRRADSVTERLRNCADSWRDVFSLSDEALDGVIRDDAIDILIDLSGHTGKNRLPVFGRKPAPVQATWLGYLNTTGLDAVDYRITDRHASPEGLLDAYHSEQLLRLPDSQWCYQPPSACQDVSLPPSATMGSITYAAFSNLAKIGPSVVELWSRLLVSVPHSRLLLVCPGLASAGEDYLARFASHGVAPGRIDLQEVKPFHQYLGLHAAADVVLDTFPYTGGTTTCHALWMGVPVVTLVGDTAPSRGGASVLNVVGLGELVAQTPEEYLGIAAGLSDSPTRLAGLRSGMRARMLASPMMNAPLFARNLERAYRSMWASWCAKQ